MEEYLLDKTGIYIAYPTSAILKSIYKTKNYETMVNNQHTKVGIAKDSFKSREKGYCSNFDDEVAFEPVAIIIDSIRLEDIEREILYNIKKEFSKVGKAREWFDTTNREKIKEVIRDTLIKLNIKYKSV